MSVQELELAVSRLDRRDLAEFAAWFEEYQATAWDEQIARDVREGRLEPLIERARAQLK
jgi:hypothetical protein